MKASRSISVSEFKQRCLELMDTDTLRKQPLAVSRRGKVVAIVSAPDETASPLLEGSVKILKKDWETTGFTTDWQLP
jgi:hypothetical protein